MKLSCSTFLELMRSEGDIPLDQEEAFSKHTAECPECKAILDARDDRVVQGFYNLAKSATPDLFEQASTEAEIDELTAPPDRKDFTRKERTVDHFLRGVLRKGRER